MDGTSSPPIARRVQVVPSPFELIGVMGSVGEAWCAVGNPSAKINQGWKMYVSAVPKNYVDLLRRIVPLIHGAGLAFKYIASIEKLIEVNAGIHGYSQIGKCVVIYVDDVTLVPELIKALRSCIDQLRHVGPLVPKLDRAWVGACVFYRYGAFRGGRLMVSGQLRKDDRANPIDSSCLDVANPFEASSVCTHQKASGSSSILEKFPVRRTLCKSGKGGVFEGIDLRDGTDVIVKIGLRHGQELPDGRDGAHFVAHEAYMYGRMVAAGLGPLLPRVIDTSDETDASILVLEKCSGPNLAVWRKEGGNDTAWLRCAIEAIRRVHAAGFTIGDAKLGNFIRGERTLSLVDLESSSEMGADGGKPKPSTFRILNSAGWSDRTVDLMHFLVSALYLEDCRGLSFKSARSIDIGEFLRGVSVTDDWSYLAYRALSSLVAQVERGSHESGMPTTWLS